MATSPAGGTAPRAEQRGPGGPDPSEAGGWRIDDLARRAGVTVDTIRYYQREGLLPPAERAGRHKLYGPLHLERLERIRDLQARRFSLAAIRVLTEDESAGLLDQLFSSDRTAVYTRQELAERAGLEAAMIDTFAEIGLLPRTEEVGPDTYDADDLRGLHAVAELDRIGIPSDVLLELVATYVRHFEAMQEEVIGLFTSDRAQQRWDADELAAIQTRMAEVAVQLIPHIETLLGYVHQRTLRRLTLQVIRAGQSAADPSPS